jgi:hypothetical protein
MLFETRTNNQSSARLKRGRIASMIPMPMAPDNPLDTLPIDTVSFQLLSYSLLDHHFPTPIFEALDNSGSEILMIFSDAEVEEEVPGGRVLDEKGEGGAREVGVALYFGLDEGFHGDAIDLAGGIYDAYFYCCVCDRDIEVWWGWSHIEDWLQKIGW